MRHRFINHARNVWDRAVTLLPRIDQLWYKVRPTLYCRHCTACLNAVLLLKLVTCASWAASAMVAMTSCGTRRVSFCLSMVFVC